MSSNWTVEDGRSNNSTKFHELVDCVTDLISNSAHDLINGSNKSVATLIVAQLAHEHGMTPALEPGESGESLDSQVSRLANFIMAEVPGEPSQSQGAIDTAIRVMDKHLKTSRPSEALFLFMGWLTSRKEVSGPFSSHHDAAQAAELVAEYCTTQGWEEPRESCKPGSWGEVRQS